MNPVVFISYSHKDKEWKNLLVEKLDVLQKQNLLAPWDDQLIGAGEDWEKKIKDAIAAASVAILLVSENFLKSIFIMTKELPWLLSRRNDGLHIFPIIIEDCEWKAIDSLAALLARPEDGRPLVKKDSERDEKQIETDLTAITSEIYNLLYALGFDYWDSQKTFLVNLPITDPEIFGRQSELAMLDAAWADCQTNIVSLVAWGGVGKTALVNAWLNRMKRGFYRGAERVFGYSFYSQGTTGGKQASADLFIEKALRWFSDSVPDEGSPWDKGERLAELVKKQRTLLIIDGLEPLQHQPGELEGRLKDPGLQCLLQGLAYNNPGLCIITTRLPIDDLKIGLSVKQIELEHLSAEAGEQLLAHLGVRGSPDELKQTAIEFDAHALALTLLGRYLVVVCKRDIHQRDKIAMLSKERKQGGHARRVMESYERWFKDKPELNILYFMGLFDRPVEEAAIAALIGKPTIEQMNLKNLLKMAIQRLKGKSTFDEPTSELKSLSHEDWKYAIDNLREVALLAKEDPSNPDTLDCHPLVREHFGEKFMESKPEAWKEAHSRLYEYYKSIAKEYPETIEEMVPLYTAVWHGCQAGQHQETFDKVFWPRIRRGGESYSWRKLGAFGSDLAALFNFFEQPWIHPVFGQPYIPPVKNLRKEIKGFVQTAYGFCLRALGRPKEAIPFITRGYDVFIALKDWGNAATLAGHLSEVNLVLGDLAEALKFAQQSVALADRSNSLLNQIGVRGDLADALHQMGCLDEAAAAFREAEEILKKKQPEYPQLYGLTGFQYCDLLLTQGDFQNVQLRAEQTLKWALNEDLGPLTIAFDHISLGRAHLRQLLQKKINDYRLVDPHLYNAVDGFRKAGAREYSPHALLARAELYRVKKEFDKAQRDLSEALTTAKRGGMCLHEANCHLEYARLHLAKGENSNAQERLTKAEEVIKEKAYHRRDPEIYLIKARLHLVSGKKKQALGSLVEAKKLINKMGMHLWDTEVKEIEEQLSNQ